MGLFKIQNVHHTLESQFVEIETVADVIVSGDCLRIVVDHHRAPAFFLDSQKGVDRAPVKFH